MHINRRKNAPRIPHDTGLSPNVLGPWLSWHGLRLSWHGPTGPCRAHQARPNHPPHRPCPALHAFALAILLLLSLPAHAQTPTPEDALTAFHTADRYIRNWSVPTAPITKDTDPKVNPRAVGVCLTLKLRGEVIARGVAWSDSIAGPDAFDPDLIRKAALAAIQQGESKLGVPNDAMRDESIKQVVKDIAISIELAGPLSAVEFTTWDDAELTLRPGLDGVAAQIRTQSASEGSKPSSSGPLQTIFPSQMMLNNMLPHRAMAAAVSKTLGEGGAAAALEDPKKLREQSAVRMYRFRVCHAAESTAPASPALLYRGQRLAPAGQVMTTQELEEFGATLARRLTTVLSSTPEEHSKEGNRDEGKANTSIAPSRALAVLALRSAQSRLPPERVNAANPLDYLEVRNDSRVSFNWNSEVASAFAFLAAHADGAGRPGASNCTSNIADSAIERTARSFAAPDFDSKVAVPTRCVVLAALSRTLAIKGGPLHWNGIRDQFPRARVQDSISLIVASENPTRLVTDMPWLGWAIVDISESRPIPSALALRRMRDQVWQHQLSATDITEDTLDMAGGIVFTSGLGDGGGHANPYPTWQCVRPLAFIATMLGDPRLTEPSERPTQIAHLMQAMRFLRQLQVDEAASWMYPDPKAALGGIRAATWDNSQPTDATSLTLLCVVELLKSLDKLSVPAAPAAEKPDK